MSLVYHLQSLISCEERVTLSRYESLSERLINKQIQRKSRITKDRASEMNGVNNNRQQEPDPKEKMKRIKDILLRNQFLEKGSSRRLHFNPTREPNSKVSQKLFTWFRLCLLCFRMFDQILSVISRTVAQQFEGKQVHRFDRVLNLNQTIQSKSDYLFISCVKVLLISL